MGQECQLNKYCNLIGAATIVAVTQVIYVIVTRPSCKGRLCQTSLSIVAMSTNVYL